MTTMDNDISHENVVPQQGEITTVGQENLDVFSLAAEEHHEFLLSEVGNIPQIDSKLRKAVKFLWQTWKFLPYPNTAPYIYGWHMTYANIYAEQCLNYLVTIYPEEFGHFETHPTSMPPPRTHDLRQRFVIMQREKALAKFNEWRTEVQQSVTKLMRAYYVQHGNLIDMDLVERCALRRLDFNDDAHKAIFLWYYFKLIPAVAGSSMFGPEINRVQLLSEAHLPEDPKAQRVPPSTEAMAIVLYNNHYQRVLEQEVWRANNPDVKQLPQSMPVPPAEAGAPPTSRPWPSLYCASSGRHNLLGGWIHMPGQPGIKKFIRVQSQCFNARQDRELWYGWENWARMQAPDTVPWELLRDEV